MPKKGKLSIDLKYFLQSDTSTIYFQNERKTKTTLSILNGNLCSTLQILTIQIKYNGKSTIDYLEEDDFTTLFFSTHNDSCNTFESKDDSSIKLLFAKENCK